MRFLHTADWQIGMKADHVGNQGQRVRDTRLTTARHVADLATAESVDFALVAGDTFEHAGVSRIHVGQVCRILDSFNCPVYVLPGNHDCLATGSVWDDACWSQAQNVHVLKEAAPVGIPGGTLFPSPLFEKDSTADPSAWIPASGGEGIRIGMAHGSVITDPGRRDPFPIPRTAAADHQLDYLALGHWHSLATYPGQDAAVRMAYSGTHETTKFGERDSGTLLIVEIREPGAAPVLTDHRVGQLEWLRIEREISETGQLEAVLQELETIGRPQETLVECILRGPLFAGDDTTLRRIEQTLEEGFLYGALNDEHLTPEPAGEAWLDGIPDGYLRSAAARLLEESTEKPEARDALRMLRRAIEEVAA
jgi:DNA repair exonuclease SbcCD nuclease subunit